MTPPPAQHVCSPLLQLPHSGLVFRCGDGRPLTGGQVRRVVASWAHVLRGATCALRPGEVVAVAAGTSAQFVLAWLAVTAAGGVAALLNTKWSATEAAAAARRVGAVALLVDQAGAAAARELCAGDHALRVVALLDDTPGVSASIRLGLDTAQELDTQAGSSGLPLLRRSGDDICTLVFTSGSTATPKAVALTHGNIHAASQAKLRVAGYCSKDVYMHAAPLCHIGGLSSAHAALCAAAVHVFPPGGAFRAGEAIRLACAHGVTAFIAVPTMLHDLLRALDDDVNGAGDGNAATAHNMAGVTKVLVGGGATTAALLARVAARLVPRAHVIGTYALSEACSSCAFRTLAVSGAVIEPPPPPQWAPPGNSQLHERDGHGAASGPGAVCCGDPAPGCVLRISGDGEICVAGPQVMACYWADPEATAAALVPDASDARLWLRTGDLGRVDASGRLWLFGRAADVIKSGGENIHASEVEAALASHTAVASAVVVPVPHDRWGAAVAACVELKPGCSWHGPRIPFAPDADTQRVASRDAGASTRASGGTELTPGALRAHLMSPQVGLARFKAPVLIAAWTGDAAVPTGATGKVDKRAVAALMTALARGAPDVWLDGIGGRSLHMSAPLRSRL